MTGQAEEISYRMMAAGDIGNVPIECQGESDEIAARIADLGSSAVLAFEGSQHVGQLQFRRYDPLIRSPSGVMDPLYWGDFGDHAPEMPANTLSIFCYHVGQLDNSSDRDTKYHGRGIGIALLDQLISWAPGAGFEAIVAKATPSVRQIMILMGGQPASVYAERGFEIVESWPDSDVTEAVHSTGVIPKAEWQESDSVVACCIKRF